MAIKRVVYQPEYNLDGEGGNAHSLMGFVKKSMKSINVDTHEDIDKVMEEMQASENYANILRIANREVGALVTWVTVNEEYAQILNDNPPQKYLSMGFKQGKG